MSSYVPEFGMPAGYPDPIVLTIGEIGVSRTHVFLPQGQFPLRGTIWTVQDSTQLNEAIPAYAIVLAIIFAVFCLLGLLFLLIKEKRYSGFIAVNVSGDGFYHSVQFPPGPATAAWVAYQVNLARGMAAVA